MKNLKLTAGALALTALIGAGSAQAGDWVYVGHTDDFMVGIDRSAIREMPVSYGAPKVTAWVVWVSKETTDFYGHEYDYRLVRNVADCRSMTKATGQTTFYLVGDSRPSHSFPGDPNDFDEMIPETIGQSILEAMCQPAELEGTGSESVSAFMDTARFILRNPEILEDYSEFPEAP